MTHLSSLEIAGHTRYDFIASNIRKDPIGSVITNAEGALYEEGHG